MTNGTINVLAVIPPPVWGGVHNRTSIVAQLLEPQGFHTIAVVPEGGEPAAERMRERGIEVIVMPMHRFRSLPDPRVHLAWLRALRTESRAMAQLIRERDIHVVATNSMPNLHAGIAARQTNIACVWEIIDTFPPMLARRVFMPLVRRWSDAILTTGRKVGLEHPGTSKLGDRWVTFFPCVDVEKFRADPAVRKSARAELGLPTDGIVIGNVATLSPMKGHKWFVRAAADLRRTHPDAKFVILGSTHLDRDDYYRELWGETKDLGFTLGEDLIVLDPVSRVVELEQAFDIFWMTSEPRSDGVPTAIGEAKALGLPVVTVDVGSTSECVTDGVSGYVVPARDPAAIADRTRRILDDPDRYAAMSVAARREAEEQYAAERGAEQHRIAYERALAHHAAKQPRVRLRDRLRTRTRGTTAR